MTEKIIAHYLLLEFWQMWQYAFIKSDETLFDALHCAHSSEQFSARCHIEDLEYLSFSQRSVQREIQTDRIVRHRSRVVHTNGTSKTRVDGITVSSNCKEARAWHTVIWD